MQLLPGSTGKGQLLLWLLAVLHIPLLELDVPLDAEDVGPDEDATALELPGEAASGCWPASGEDVVVHPTTAVTSNTVGSDNGLRFMAHNGGVGPPGVSNRRLEQRPTPDLTSAAFSSIPLDATPHSNHSSQRAKP